MANDLYTLQEGPFGGFVITKYDSLGLEMLSQYTMPDEITCTCPAAHRETCRHRQMIGQMMDRIDTHWFYDYDNDQWLRFVNGKMVGEVLTVNTLPQPETPVEGTGPEVIIYDEAGEITPAMVNTIDTFKRRF